MSLKRGFVDVPIGDHEVSELHEYPRLQENLGPALKYVQEESLDLCVSKSFASALFAFGIEDKAHKINEGKRQQKRMRLDLMCPPLDEE